MRISNGREFIPEEKRFYRINLIKNVVDSIKQLIEGVELLNFQYDVNLETLIEAVIVIILFVSERGLSEYRGAQDDGVFPPRGESGPPTSSSRGHKNSVGGPRHQEVLQTQTQLPAD